MTRVKQLGICVDETGIRVMEHVTGAIKMITLPSLPEGANQAGTVFKKSGNFRYDIELEQHSNYVDQLKSIITNTDSLLLFGPTNLKVDLYNVLKQDDSFSKINITLKQADTMSESEQQAFVMDYFEGTVA